MDLSNSLIQKTFTTTLAILFALSAGPVFSDDSFEVKDYQRQQEETTAAKPKAPVTIKPGKGDHKSPDITVSAQEIPMAYWQGGDGHYNKIFDLMVDGYGGTVKTTFLPSERSIRMFVSKEADCSYIHTSNLSQYNDLGINPNNLIFIGPINEINVTAYVQTGSDDIKALEDLKGKTFAADVNLVDFIRSQGVKESMALQSQVQMIELLAKGRVDALVGWDYDLDLLVKKLNLEDKLQPTSMNLDPLVDGMVCHRNDKTKEFVKAAQTQLNHATSNGTLAAIFNE
jgi:hypothetical protein